MTKKILAITYSQSGQLFDIIERFIVPFEKHEIDYLKFEPEKAFDFPWKTSSFFNVMPESVLEVKTKLKPLHFKYDCYDLIIIGYQPWYLSPSIPISSLMQEPEFKKLLNNTPVITIIGARNMWLMSQGSMKNYISNAGGNLVANLPLIDKHNNFISALTILYWMLTGKKDRMLNIFPSPGVSRMDIESAREYGEIAHNALIKDSFENIQEKFIVQGGIKIKTDLLFIEPRAKKIFKVWARFIKNNGNNRKLRKILIHIFKYYLIVALFVIAPVVLTIYTMFVFPITKNSINKKKRYYCNVK